MKLIFQDLNRFMLRRNEDKIPQSVPAKFDLFTTESFETL